MTLSLLFNQAAPRNISLAATDTDDLCTAVARVSIAGSLSATESPQGLPGAFWNNRYWAVRYWATGYWVPNTVPNAVLISATLAVSEAGDTATSSAQTQINAVASSQESVDALAASGQLQVVGSTASTESSHSLTATGTAAGGVVGSVSGTLAAQENDDLLQATAILIGVALPAGAVGWWPQQTVRRRQATASIAVVDGDDRAAVRVQSVTTAVGRLIESTDGAISAALVVPSGSLHRVEAADRAQGIGRVDWSDLIAQEDDAIVFGEDGLLFAELLREAA